MENTVPDIFNSTLVHSGVDDFWEAAKTAHLRVTDTVVLSVPFEQGSPEEVQLLKMLGACKLTADQYQIVQLSANELLSWNHLREATKATKILMLGILPAQLGVSAMMVPHEVNNFNGVQWMPTFSLDQIAANAQLKQHLWVNVFQKVYF